MLLSVPLTLVLDADVADGAHLVIVHKTAHHFKLITTQQQSLSGAVGKEAVSVCRGYRASVER